MERYTNSLNSVYEAHSFIDKQHKAVDKSKPRPAQWGRRQSTSNARLTYANRPTVGPPYVSMCSLRSRLLAPAFSVMLWFAGLKLICASTKSYDGTKPVNCGDPSNTKPCTHR